MQNDDEYEYDDLPSRGQLKREAEQAQHLGEQLIALKESELAALDLPEPVADAIRAARTIRQHGALRRQRQYIGKLMRKIDIEPIRAALADREQDRHRNARDFKALETWRERLLNDGDTALKAWLAEHPQSDAEKLRGLIDNACKAPNPATRKTASRSLFRYLSDQSG
jgi:ribosome-associated protein